MKDNSGLKAVLLIILSVASGLAFLGLPVIYGLEKEVIEIREGSTEILEIKDGVGAEKFEVSNLGQNPLGFSNSYSPVKLTPILVQENGTNLLTVRDGDLPKGPCDFGDLVRAARAHLYPTESKEYGEVADALAIARMKLVVELSKCEPSKYYGSLRK